MRSNELDEVFTSKPIALYFWICKADDKTIITVNFKIKVKYLDNLNIKLKFSSKYPDSSQVLSDHYITTKSQNVIFSQKASLVNSKVHSNNGSQIIPSDLLHYCLIQGEMNHTSLIIPINNCIHASSWNRVYSNSVFNFK